MIAATQARPEELAASPAAAATIWLSREAWRAG
jgi:hypothetical protein